MQKVRRAFLARSAASLSLALALGACAPGGLNRTGTVRLWTAIDDPSVAAGAGSLKGLSLNDVSAGADWPQALAQDDRPDLVFAKLSRAVVEAKSDGLLADLEPYWPKLATAKTPGAAAYNDPAAAVLGGRFFLPAVVQVWGLWYNPATLSGLGLEAPTDLPALETAFAAARDAGLIPLSLGAQSAWTASALISLLDLRLNGPEAYAKLLSGERRLDDPSLLPVYATLARWRNQAWTDPEAPALGWAEALAKLESGQAVFLVLPSYAIDRAKLPDSLGFLPFPAAGAAAANPPAKRGELAEIDGFVVAANAKVPQAALALADAYTAGGAAGRTKPEYRLPTAVPAGSKVEPGNGFAQAQRHILEGAAAVFPQFDDLLPSRSGYALDRIIARFFAPTEALDALALGALLKSVALNE